MSTWVQAMSKWVEVMSTWVELFWQIDSANCMSQIKFLNWILPFLMWYRAFSP